MRWLALCLAVLASFVPGLEGLRPRLRADRSCMQACACPAPGARSCCEAAGAPRVVSPCCCGEERAPAAASVRPTVSWLPAERAAPAPARESGPPLLPATVPPGTRRPAPEPPPPRD